MRFGEFKATDRIAIKAFHKECNRVQLPAVWIEQKRKYVNLFWDLTELPPSFDRLYRPEFEKQFMERVHGAFLVSYSRRSRYVYSFMSGKIDSLPADLARRMGEFVFYELKREVRRAQRLTSYVDR